MRGDQLARQWKIICLLESRKSGMTAVEMSSYLDINVRTIYRDLEAIQEAGFPVYVEKQDKNSYWMLLEGFKANIPVPLTTTELMSIHMSRDILRVFEGTIFQESMESLFSKVRASLPPETIRYLDNIAANVSVGFGPHKNYQVLKDLVATLSDATAKRNQVEILYGALSTGEELRRRVDPYQVWAMNGSFYLIGRCHMRDAVRTFAMDRIKELTVLNEIFAFPEDFSLEDYLQTAFRVMTGPPEVVRVWFRESAAQVIKERIWHPSQEIREQEDGSLVVTLKVPINYEVISWILGFGSASQVLEPVSLRSRIQGELESSLNQYRSGTGSKKNVTLREKDPLRVS